MSSTRPDRNLALELVRVTEAAAMGAGRWIGRGDKNAADQAAVDAMRAMLDTVAMTGVVVIGEGEKDEAPMLYNGEEVGEGGGPEVDVAVDPLEGTRLTALGQPNAIAVIAAAERGSLFYPGAAVYMEKIAVGADAIGAIDINASPAENIAAVAEAKGRRVTDIRVTVLERDRHEELIGELREAGARVNLIRDGDVAPAIAAARPETGVDMLYGVGGTPEGVISACALKCVGGGIQAKLWPRSDDERQALVDAGYDLDRVLTTNDLVTSDNVFVAATGVTTGALLRGVRYVRDGAITVEKSGQNEFDFEYGDQFGEKIEEYDPDFSKVLVRYNPEGDQVMNERQVEKLRRLSEWLHEHHRKYLFELLVPAEPEQLEKVDGDADRYDAELRPDLMMEAILQLQNGGVEADIWKIEGVDDREACREIAQLCRREGRDRVSCVVLGRGASDAKVDEWLRAGSGVDGYIGFAIGRSIFGESVKAFAAGEGFDRDAAVEKISEKYRRFIDVYEGP